VKGKQEQRLVTNDTQLDSLERELRKYMLGELTAAEEASFEERLLSRDEEFRGAEELADLVMDELVEEYVSEELGGKQRLAFERNLLPSPKIQRKMVVQQTLRASAGRRARRPGWMLRLGLWFQPLGVPAPALAAALAVVLLAGGAWSLLQFRSLRQQLDAARTQQAQLTAAGASLQRQLDEERKQQADRSARPEPAPGVVSLVLLPGVQRSAGGNASLPIPTGERLIELRLDLGLDEYASYQAALSDSSGEVILEQRQLRPTSAGGQIYVALQLPARLLREDDYTVVLRGVSTSRQVVMIDRYGFRAVRR
jgi:hypothetical protein